MKSKFRKTLLSSAATGALLVTLTGTAAAVDNFWNGGTAEWNTATNWSLGRVPTNANGATTGDTFDDAVINTAAPNIATISSNLATTPRDIVVGSGAGADGTVNHVAGIAATGTGNWMFVGRDSGTGTYNLADTAATGTGLTGFGQGGGTLNANGRLYVGGWNSPGTATFNVNTTGALAIAYQLQVGNGSGTGVFNLESGTVTTGTEWVEFGNGAGSHGTFNMSGGSFTKGGNDHFSIGTNGGSGTGNISGGSLTVNNEIWLGQAGGSLGILNFSGGTIGNNSYVAIGRETGTGNLNMTGGTWTKTGGGSFIVGASGPGSMIQSGGLVEVLSGDTWIGELNGSNGNFTLSDTGEFRATYFQVGRNAGSTGTANLMGGTLKVSQIAGGAGTEFVYFDGTQIIATANQTTFIGGIDANHAVINFGGLKIDSNGLNLGVPQALTGFGGVVKSGAGTLTLTGANTYEGGNVVNAGKLILSTASTLNGDATVADGAAFGVLQANPAASLDVPNATFGTSTGASLDIDLGNAAGNPPVAPLNVTGALTLNGVTTVNVTDSFPAVGTIPLVSYVVPKSGFGSFVLGTLPPGTVGTLSDDGFGTVSLNLTQATVLTWKGVTGSTTAVWDLGTTANWIDKSTGSPATYADPGSVLFDDTASSLTIQLDTTVAPGKIAFNNTSQFRIQGAGKISGSGSLIKQGTGGLLLFNTTNPNDYTGATVLEGGTTQIRSIANGGAPSSIGASSASPSNLVLAGGTLSAALAAATTTDRGFTISGTNSTLSSNRDLTMSGQVIGTAGNFTKTGSAKLILTYPGANGFGTVSPGLRVTQSTLELIGSGTQTNTVGGDCWIGHTTTQGANLTLSSTSLNVQNWLVLGRGNGNTGLASTLTATNSVITTGNVTTGYIADQTLNNSTQAVTLTNTTWTNNGAVQLAESAGSTTTMTMAGTSALTTAGALRMAMGTGTSTVTLTIQDTASITKNGGWLAIGDGGTAKATVTVKNSGSLISTAGDFNIGDGGTSQGTLNLSDTGTVSSKGIAFIGKGSGTKGTLNQTGGTFTGQDWISIGRYTGGSGNAIGTVAISGGTFNQTNPNASLIVGEAGTGTLTLSGTGAVVSSGTVLISNAGSGIGTLNLNGGTLTTRQITAGAAGAGMGTFNFNGGTLRAGTGSLPTFMSLMDVVNVQAGGAIIDTNGQDLTINQSLQDGGGGLTKSGSGALYLNGIHSYAGATQVNAGTLAGTGDYAGSITVASGSNLNPGSPGGTLYAIAATFAGGSSLTIDMAESVDTLQAETLDISGAKLLLNGTPNLPVHVLARYQTLTGTFTETPVLPAGYSLTYDAPAANGYKEIVLSWAANAFETWAQSHITAIDPSADATPGGDPDGDGSNNLSEFALDGNPLSGAASGKMLGKVATVAGSQVLVLTLPVRNGAAFSGTTEAVSDPIDGLTYKIQASDDLGAWTLQVTEVTGADKTTIENDPRLQPLDTGWTYRTFRSPGAVTGDPSDYLRAVISAP
ncbi:MAG: autotransporter-associated beta strand repeat-containing protein [Verrucomicrobia bacterium]|nr:autotransporter-associated beta strand repeat-containing protein [Verrucomicrobiota bacterium]